MISTLASLTDQIMNHPQITGGAPSVVSGIQPQDVRQLVIQACNRQLKADSFSSMEIGEMNMGNLMLTTYENVPVTSRGKVATAKLPCYPIKLPKNAGCFEISKQDDILGVEQFIPIPAGQFTMITGFAINTDVLGQIAYINEALDIIFTRNIVEADDIKEVRIKLVVSDLDQLGEYDPLPIYPDMELAVIQDVISLLGGRGPQDTVSDNVSEVKING